MQQHEINESKEIVPDLCFEKFELIKSHVIHKIRNIFYEKKDVFMEDSLCKTACTETEQSICFILNHFSNIDNRKKQLSDQEVKNRINKKFKNKK